MDLAHYSSNIIHTQPHVSRKKFTTKKKLVVAFENDNNAPPSIINRRYPIPTNTQ